MTEKLKTGDKVEWETPRGKTSGTVKKKLTKPTDIKTHHVAASKDNPEYLVESDKSGGQAAHKTRIAEEKAKVKNTMTDDDKKTVEEFKSAVNMTPKKLEDWLKTEESKAVGFKEDGEGESVGHKSGKRIIEILGKKQADYTAADLKHIHKVVGYIHRHSAQKPDGDITETNWRYSLMNWGHDPAK